MHKKVKLITHDCLPIVMLLYIMLHVHACVHGKCIVTFSAAYQLHTMVMRLYNSGSKNELH